MLIFRAKETKATCLETQSRQMVSGQNLEVSSVSERRTLETSNQTHLNTSLAFIVVFLT